MQYVVTTFPILAPLPVSDNGSALGLYIFIRSFFSVCFLFCPSCVSEDTDTLCIGLGIDYRLNGSRESTQDKTPAGVPAIATRGAGDILRRHSSDINARRTFEDPSARCICRILGGVVAGPIGDICLGTVEHNIYEGGADADSVG